ncbi:unnamed protein product [Rotaria sp. Silwood1]|nr:unnamed protein product [Rotaria sp. Silwood1]CAF1278889.1 unnamed protein product [Rotaria sp. Silwood1]CAF3523494.1 unnamed protein product [Rotaria sp. Silwood1]CAF3558626.1 unnamed protein product [Rotaria sp. Silwood1]CAF4612662.1 unnamed protein product [Rotaria sp. Silwood1]
MVFPIFIIIGLLTQVLCQDSALNSSDGIVIHQVEVQTSSIGRIKYEDGEVILYQNQRKPTDIFFTPFPRVNPVNSECNENILSGHIELSLSVELYTSLLIQVIQSYMKQYFPKLCNENSTCDASLLPMSAIRLVQKGLRTDKSRQMYTINDEWRSNTLLLQSIEFVIYTMNQSVCEQLRSSIVKQCYLSNFEIHYSLHSEKTVERQVEINTEQITGTSMYNRILSQFPRSDTIALSGGDFKQLISEVSDKITMKLRVQEGFDSQLQDPIALDKVLERQLQLKQVHLEKADDQLWNSLYWTQDLTRPDRLAKAINTIVRKDSTDSNHFLYDSQAAKNIHKLGLTQHDIDRLEQFDKLLATHAHKKSSSGSGTSHSGGGGSLHVFGRFKIGGSGSSSSQSQSHQFEDDQKVTDSIHDKKNHSNHLNVTNIESNNDTQYVFSRDQVEKYLSELSDHIHLEGEIILPKPINAHILKLSTLRSETKLLSHTVLVRTRSNVHVLPLRCPSKETKASTSNTMNQYRWLDDKVEQLKTTIEKLTNKLSELNNQMSERITQVQQQCTNQVSEVQKKWMNKVNTSLQCENNIIAIKNTMSQEYKKLKKQITSIQQMAIRGKEFIRMIKTKTCFECK